MLYIANVNLTKSLHQYAEDKISPLRKRVKSTLNREHNGFLSVCYLKIMNDILNHVLKYIMLIMERCYYCACSTVGNFTIIE